MIDWKPNPEGGLEAELHHEGFRAYLWAWPDVSMSAGRRIFGARVVIAMLARATT